MSEPPPGWDDNLPDERDLEAWRGPFLSRAFFCRSVAGLEDHPEEYVYVGVNPGNRFEEPPEELWLVLGIYRGRFVGTARLDVVRVIPDSPNRERIVRAALPFDASDFVPEVQVRIAPPAGFAGTILYLVTLNGHAAAEIPLVIGQPTFREDDLRSLGIDPDDFRNKHGSSEP